MRSSNKEKQDQIRNERREQILDAAVKVFSRRGVVGTKMSMIANAAGISPGLLYHYFKSKDELFTTLVEWAMEQSHSTMMYAYQFSGSPIEKIRTLTELILCEGDSAYFMLIHQARTSDGVPESAKRLIKHHSMETYVDQLYPLFKEGQQVGDIAAGDPKELVYCYLSVISGLMLLATQEDEGQYKMKVDILLRMITGS
ncbi:TetR/AcrR family transcriptional regulator [Oceanobacillus jeddahense]|uniref:TetR/AcrR family transcriptional regulator n=1 Tax=Oceanobacillus jeddahense TaxID=1462527 RepID=A0ABY5JLG1_9BACI|nr:TetR/AcrR family transcriptional regulator [Oceanobacillus jeddahense]UUI01138.1 TetR/AcrR family transcriptional regulator [Oceanobacillus jeddahense]